MTDSTAADLVALLFFSLALSIPFLSIGGRTLLSGEVLVITIGTIARVVLCALSASGLFLAPELDSLAFHNQASEIARTGAFPEISQPGVHVFTSVIGAFYIVFGTSILLADSIGTIAFALSCVVFTWIGRELWPRQSFAIPLLIFSLSPAMLLYANFNYREPYQILFLACATYYAIRFRRNGNIVNLAFAFAFLAVFASVHSRFMVVVPLLLTLAVLYPVRGVRQPRWNRMLGTLVGVAAAAGVFYWMSVSLTDSKVAQAVTAGAIDKYLEEFGAVASAVGGRTAMPYYPTGGTIDLLTLAPLLLLQFMFAPLFPWLVSEAQDLVALTDTLIRTGALSAAVAATFSTDSRVRNDAWFLLLFYFSFSMAAALGTWTVGTAMRHQIKDSWILLVLGAPVLNAWVGALLPRQGPLRA